MAIPLQPPRIPTHASTTLFPLQQGDGVLEVMSGTVIFSST
jgi:hypothetical protein